MRKARCWLSWHGDDCTEYHVPCEAECVVASDDPACDVFFGTCGPVLTLTGPRVPHGVAYGLAQTLALIPGVSRSGATISMGLALGYTRVEATRFAFLLAIPAVFGSGLFELNTAVFNPAEAGPLDPLATVVATVVALVVGYAVIAWLMRFLTTRSFLPFVIYRLVLGGGLLVALSTGYLQP